MELTKKEIKVLLILLEREKHEQGLMGIEETLVNKFEERYKELGGYIREV